MGIMDVLESLSGPEYEESAPQAPEETPVEEVASAEEPETAGEETAAETAPPQEPQYTDIPLPEPDIVPKKRFSLRAEVVMAIVAAFAAVLAGVMVLLCMPYFQAEAEDEDPQSLQQWHEPQHATEPAQLEITEPTVPETEPAISQANEAQNPL